MYSSLPKQEATFEFNETDEYGIVYKGEFVVRCVSDIGTRHRVELEKTRMMADYANPSPGLVALADSLAEIRGRIVKAPDWWTQDLDNGALLLDSGILYKLYDKCMECEKAWKASVIQKGAEAQSQSK